MLKNLTLASTLLLFCPFLMSQQQTFVEKEISQTHHYSIVIEGIEVNSDEAIIKDMKSTLKGIFDVLPKFNVSNGQFEIDSPYVFSRDKVEYLLSEQGYTLIRFNTNHKIEHHELD